MLRQIQLIRNIGQFDSTTGAANAGFSRLSLIFAENGRGKTTLSAILRSLQSGSPNPIQERHRLGAANPPHVVLDFDNPTDNFQFQNDRWNGTCPDIKFFDDQFISENVHQGPIVVPSQRQNLHELVLGEQGVQMSRRFQELLTQVETHGNRLRNMAANFPANMLNGMSIESFCNLHPATGIDEREQAINQRLAAISQQDQIQTQPGFSEPTVPDFDTARLNAILSRDIVGLDERAVTLVKEHVGHIGTRGEEWVAQGLQRMAVMPGYGQTDTCPFCAQGVENSPVFSYYRGFFSAEYRQLQEDIAQQIGEVEEAHGTGAQLRLERFVGQQERTRQFWATFEDIPDVGLNTTIVTEAWSAAREAVLNELRAKAAAPLESRRLSLATVTVINRFQETRGEVATVASRVRDANQIIAAVRMRARTEDATQLQAELKSIVTLRARFEPAMIENCAAYIAECQAKAQAEALKAAAREALDTHRQSVFPRFQADINRHLERFGAGFRLCSVSAENMRYGNFCNYEIEILGVGVPVAGGEPTPGAPSFANTLSAGDRNTLALAFFLTNLEAHPRLADQIVVIDDPLSSLDENRHVTTTQIVKDLIGRVRQVVVLSHNPSFLARVCDRLPGHIEVSCHQVRRNGAGSEIVVWDRSELFTTDHDRRDRLLREYLTGTTGRAREAATSIRPHLEGYLRVVCPSVFRPGTLVGQFVDRCRGLIGTVDEILSAGDVRELGEINEFSSPYHHETNPNGFQTASINDTALTTFVRRTLLFTGL